MTIIPLSRLSINNSRAGANFVMHTRSMIYAQGVMEHILADLHSDHATMGGYDNVVSNWNYRYGIRDGMSWNVSISPEYTSNGIYYREVTVQVQNAGRYEGGISLNTLIVK